MSTKRFLYVLLAGIFALLLVATAAGGQSTTVTPEQLRAEAVRLTSTVDLLNAAADTIEQLQASPSPSPSPEPSPEPSPSPSPSPEPSPSPSPTPVALPGPEPSGPGGGVFSVSCALDHQAPDDPIVFPGQPGVPHSHDFFGALGVDSFTTPDQLPGRGTTCGHSADTAAYWAPSLVAPDGSIVQPTNILAYYRAGVGSPARAFPQGLELVAGGTDPQRFGFSCSDQKPYSPTPVNCGASYLKLHVTFPSCWDGVNLDSPDHRSHLAYAVGSDCPSSYPVLMPKLTVHIQYRGVQDGASGYSLAPDPQGVIPSPHADFVNGWNQAVLERIMAECVNAGLDCKKDTTVGL